MNASALLKRLAVGIVVITAGCGEIGRREKGALNSGNFEGRIMNVDEWTIEIENKSSHDLDDVNVSFAFDCLNGDKKQLKQHWSNWKHGETKTVVARDSAGDVVENFSAASGEGASTEFFIHFTVSVGDEF